MSVQHVDRSDASERTNGSHEGWRPTFRQVVAALAIVVFVVFAVANRESVRVDLLAGDVDAPLVAVIAGCGALGFVVGVLLCLRRERER